MNALWFFGKSNKNAYEHNLQAAYLSQPTSREVSSLHGHKVSARSQPTRVKSTLLGQGTMGTLEI